MIKVSVIVPLYNAGKYLTRCIDSLLAQTLTDIEFIFISDAPTDGSDRVVRNYAEKDNRIVFLENEENFHVGLSRNKGLDIAKGEYVAFADHDDEISSSMYEELYTLAQCNNADIVVSHPYKLVGDACVSAADIDVVRCDIDMKSYMMSDLIGGGNDDADTSSFCNLHNCLYNRKMIEIHNIRFVDTRYATPEDLIFNIEAAYYAHNIIYTDKAYYYHRYFEVSESRAGNYTNWQKRLNGLNVIHEFLTDNTSCHLYMSNFDALVTRQLMHSLLSEFRRTKDCLALFNHIVELKRKYPYIKNSFRKYRHEPNARSRFTNFLRRILAYYIAI